MTKFDMLSEGLFAWAEKLDPLSEQALAVRRAHVKKKLSKGNDLSTFAKVESFAFMELRKLIPQADGLMNVVLMHSRSLKERGITSTDVGISFIVVYECKNRIGDHDKIGSLVDSLMVMPERLINVEKLFDCLMYFDVMIEHLRKIEKSYMKALGMHENETCVNDALIDLKS